MNFIKGLFASHPTRKFLSFSVKCNHCGEIIHGQVNINNEPSMEIDEKGKPFYTCRKVLIGSEHCFEHIEVVFRFDENRHVLDRWVSGGEMVNVV